MADEKTKYTHITARCSQLMKALCYVTLEQTEDTLSTTYWRLREGKGLLNSEDKYNLAIISMQITQIRRYMSSPVPLNANQHRLLNRMRDELIARMESYRDWLAIGSKPVYLTDIANHDFNVYTLEMAVGLYDPNIVEADIETQKKFWKNIDMDKFLSCDFTAYCKASHCLENMSKPQALDILERDYKLRMLPTDKTWQIRTDMEHRSSIGANINQTMYWLYKVPAKSQAHVGMIISNDQVLDDFTKWKAKAKAQYKEKKRIEDDVLGTIEAFINAIQVPTVVKELKPNEETLI